MRRVGFLVLVLLFCGLVLFGTACSDNGDDDGGGPTVYTLEVTALEDAYIDEGLPDNNFGSVSDLYAGWGADYKTNMFLYFEDFSALPSNAVIQSVELHLYVTDSSNSLGSGFTFGLYDVLLGWSEDTITWNNAPTLALEATLTGPADGFTGWFTIATDALKELVEVWVDDPGSNMGIAICPEFTSTDDEFGCVSSEGAAGQEPKLVIKYTLP